MQQVFRTAPIMDKYLQRKIVNCEEAQNSVFTKTVLAAADAIKEYDCAAARSLLKEAAAMNIENPEIYNLLGISYEREGDRVNASRFYRVAYYMDQNFLAPSENLSRVCNVLYRGFKDVEWGLEKIGGENI